MKAFFRSGPVQGVLSVLLGGYMWMVLHTIRWKRINQEAMQAQMDSGGPAIACFWHGDIAMAITAKPVVRRREARILISLSPDGEFVSRAIGMHGMPSIRGSSTKKEAKGEKAKGGAAAAREAFEWLGKGGVLVITPDGPRGPAQQMAAGAVRLARRSGAPVFLMGLAARPVKRLGSWDRMALPRPFGKGVIVWDGPLYAPDDADLATLAQEWSVRLTAAGERARAELT